MIKAPHELDIDPCPDPFACLLVVGSTQELLGGAESLGGSQSMAVRHFDPAQQTVGVGRTGRGGDGEKTSGLLERVAPLCIKPEPQEQLAQFEPHAGDFFHLRDVTRHQLVQRVP